MITDNLFLSVSNIIGVRVTPENLRTQFDAVSSTGGITSKVKSDILKELLLAFAELEKKIEEEWPLKLYNPTLEDISTYIDKLGPNPRFFTLKAGDIAEFPDDVGALLKQKLLDKTYYSRPLKERTEKELERITKLIEVKWIYSKQSKIC